MKVETNATYLAELKKAGKLMANSFPAFCEKIASGEDNGKKFEILLDPSRGHIYVGAEGDQWVKFPLAEFLASAADAAAALKAADPNKGKFFAPFKGSTSGR